MRQAFSPDFMRVFPQVYRFRAVFMHPSALSSYPTDCVLPNPFAISILSVVAICRQPLLFSRLPAIKINGRNFFPESRKHMEQVFLSLGSNLGDRLGKSAPSHRLAFANSLRSSRSLMPLRASPSISSRSPGLSMRSSPFVDDLSQRHSPATGSPKRMPRVFRGACCSVFSGSSTRWVASAARRLGPQGASHHRSRYCPLWQPRDPHSGAYNSASGHAPAPLRLAAVGPDRA